MTGNLEKYKILKTEKDTRAPLSWQD